MSAVTFPSPQPTHRRADFAVHVLGLCMIFGAGWVLISNSIGTLDPRLTVALIVYVLCALVSNQASFAYHFSTLHDRRILLRRIDHAAIYPSISGTFTPFFVLANTPLTHTLLWLCWALTAVAIWHKITHTQVKTRWSTASYLGLGAIGLCALPDLTEVPPATPWFIVAGSACYVIGTAFYARKTLPFRYAIWHMCVNVGALCMFAAVWVALF